MKVLGKNKNFLAIPAKISNYKNSKIVILQAPLEKTVSYGSGTKLGPKEIINASHYVEFYDEELDKELCYDLGICTLQELSFKNLSHSKSLKRINETVTKLLNELREKELIDFNRKKIIIRDYKGLKAELVYKVM